MSLPTVTLREMHTASEGKRGEVLFQIALLVVWTVLLNYFVCFVIVMISFSFKCGICHLGRCRLRSGSCLCSELKKTGILYVPLDSLNSIRVAVALVGPSLPSAFRDLLCWGHTVDILKKLHLSREAPPEPRSSRVCPKENLKGYRECASSVITDWPITQPVLYRLHLWLCRHWCISEHQLCTVKC